MPYQVSMMGWVGWRLVGWVGLGWVQKFWVGFWKSDPWPTLYHRCCQHNRRWLLSTGYDGRTLLTTAVFAKVEQKAVLMFKHIFVLNQNRPISRRVSGGSEYCNRISGPKCYIAFHSNSLIFRCMTTGMDRRRTDDGQTDVGKHRIFGP